MNPTARPAGERAARNGLVLIEKNNEEYQIANMA
jgi:hypothetical protein